MGKPSRIEQIYSDIKQVLFETPMRPGQRVDVEALAAHFGVSNIPIRMLMNRLVGEGVLEVAPHEGYVVPGATEQRIRDVHQWNQQILLLALETAMDEAPPSAFPELDLNPDEVVEATEALFLAIADFSRNSETRRAVNRVNDRLRPIRQLNAGKLIDLTQEMAAFRVAWADQDLYALHRLVWQYHHRRLDLVANLVALAYSQ